MSGDVELVLQWRYNARLDFCPFDDFVDEHEGEMPNELRIALIRAQGLAIADKNLLSKGGSSDPRCTFELTGVDDPWKPHTESTTPSTQLRFDFRAGRTQSRNAWIPSSTSSLCGCWTCQATARAPR